MTRILVVDDEQDLCEVLQFNLEAEGYEVDTAESAEAALRLDLSSYSLLLLDVMMGEMSGFDLARTLRQRAATARTPIIFITAMEGEEAMVRGLDIGGDDYIRKPLAMREVLARVRAVLRRAAQSKESSHSTPETQEGASATQGLVIDHEAKSVSVDGEPVAVTRIEFEILSLLVAGAGRVFGREELLRRCWPHDTYVLDRTVDVNITRLRKKIGPYGKKLKTRFGYGYVYDN